MRELAVFVLGLACGWLLLRAITKRRTAMKAEDVQAHINSAVETIKGLDSAVAGGVSALALVHSLWVTATDALKAANPDIDTSQLDAVAAASESARVSLANAIAANTPASDEVHTDDGGTGTAPVNSGGTVVDPANVDTTPVEAPPASAGDGSGGGTGGDAVKQAGEGDQG